MSLFWILTIGLLVGWAVRKVLPKAAPCDLFITVLLGMTGALLVACIGRASGWYADAGLNNVFGSVFGAAAMLPVGHSFRV